MYMCASTKLKKILYNCITNLKQCKIVRFNYNLVIKTRVLNKRTYLGKVYFENIYIINISKIKAKVI